MRALRILPDTVNKMAVLMHDRVFWIYLLVTFFFIIIGIGAIISSNDPYMITISIFWLLSNVALMIVVYHASLNWTDPNDNLQICLLDANSGCIDAGNRVWLFINAIFIFILVFSTLWAGELKNTDSGPLRTMSGVLVLLGGLVLCSLINGRSIPISVLPFWVAISFLLIWFGLTLYVVLT